MKYIALVKEYQDLVNTLEFKVKVQFYVSLHTQPEPNWDRSTDCFAKCEELNQQKQDCRSLCRDYGFNDILSGRFRCADLHSAPGSMNLNTVFALLRLRRLPSGGE